MHYCIHLDEFEWIMVRDEIRLYLIMHVIDQDIK